MKMESQDDYHLHDDEKFIREGINTRGHFYFYVRQTLNSEKKKNKKLLRQLQKTKKVNELPKEKLEAIRKLAKENKEGCRAALSSKINNLTLDSWRE